MTIDGIFEVFNLFNRSNFTAVNNVFGTGRIPQPGARRSDSSRRPRRRGRCSWR